MSTEKRLIEAFLVISIALLFLELPRHWEFQALASAPGQERFDFEDGTLQGWTFKTGVNAVIELRVSEVEHVSGLAQLSLTEEEKELFRGQLSAILEYAERLQRLDTHAIPPTSTVLPLRSIMRDDNVVPSLPLRDVLANAPEVENELFQVPIILEEEG